MSIVSLSKLTLAGLLKERMPVLEQLQELLLRHPHRQDALLLRLGHHHLEGLLGREQQGQGEHLGRLEDVAVLPQQLGHHHHQRLVDHLHLQGDPRLLGHLGHPVEEEVVAPRNYLVRGRPPTSLKRQLGYLRRSSSRFAF